MYSSAFSKVSKSSPQGQKRTQYRSKGKSCGYYMRIVFFFSSLIQSLIIVSLVLFLVYGKSQDSASTSRIHDLEETFSRLSIENVALRHQRKNLTNLLNTTLTEKARNDWDLAKLVFFSNISAILIQDIDKRLQQCNTKLYFCESSLSVSARCPPQFGQQPTTCNCGLLAERLKARLELVESNFTQSTQRMRMEMDQTAKERDNINLEVIRLRRDKFTHEKEVEFFSQKCKDDFSQSLSGISNVSKAFLEKINSLFPSHIAFQLTCPKQREHLEQIRTNCTSLSLEVEDKLQRYLNTVGGQVSVIQGENSRLKAENWRLSDDYRWCSNNRSGLILQNRQNLDKLQRKNDEDKEKLLMDKIRLNGEIEVLNNNVKYKSRAIDHLTEQNRQLNMSCMSKPGSGGFTGGLTQSQPGWGLPGGVGQHGGAGTGGMGSYGTAYNKPAISPGSSSAVGSAYNKPAISSGSTSSIGSAYNKPAISSGSSSSIGSAYNKPASTGTGSSSSSSSSTGSVYNKPASTGTGSSSSSSSSTGSVYNKPASTGTGSSSSSSSSTGSVYNKPASTGTGSSSSSSSSTGSVYNKPAVIAKGSVSSGTGQQNKPTTAVKSPSWWGISSSSSAGQSRTGSGTGTGRGSSTGSSSGGTGSSFDAGKTGGLGSGQINVAQHLRDLQRIINPSGPEEKQDLSRMLG
ncbi:plasmalemma vesicle associated protein a [Sebastes umbrosus]|uniref:plasmalemma vesicle associated protein a n=1 Tax=Sebastes umbrosus TaxID=72105 RepID=UPI00189C8731|nr:plasmalemma vesicle associated protein a [Sebastes umbrosus]